MQQYRCSIITAAIVLMAGLVFVSASSAADPYYKGKTITVIVTSSPGGGSDTTARLVSRFLPKYLPGNPSSIVQNMPGGGGTVASNYFVRRSKPNGLTLLQDSSSSLSSFVRGGKRIKYNPQKYENVGSIMRGGSILMVRKDAKARLMDPSAKKVVVGDPDGIRTWVAMTVWGAKYLGWNDRWIFGYAGTGELVLALRQGEIDMWGTANAKLIRGLVKDGVVDTMVTVASKRRKDFPNVPTFEEMLGDKKPTGVSWQAYQVWAGPSNVDKFLVAPPGTPAKVMTLLRGAWAKMVQDPEFQSQATKFFGEAWITRDAAETKTLIKQVTTAPKEVKDFLRKIKTEYGLPIGKKRKK